MRSSLFPIHWRLSQRRYCCYPAADKKLFYRADTYDRFIIEELWKFDEYFLEQLELPAQGVIVDVGAHIGAFALRAAHLFPGRQILAFEPVYDNYKLLKNNIQANHCQHIIPFRAAITSSSQNRIPIYLSQQNTAGHSSIYQEHSDKIFAPAIQLIKIFKKYHIDTIALLKIDCEGGEYDMLYKMEAENLKKIHYLALEYHPDKQYDFASLQSWLALQGFQMLAHKAGYFEGQGTALFINLN